jgi:predicted O-methyltransferase YrrM
MNVNASVIFRSSHTQWLNPVQIGTSTLLNLGMRRFTLESVVDVLRRLEPDGFIDFILRYYEEGLRKFGDSWSYADQLTVLYAAGMVLHPRRYLEIGVFRGRSMAVVGNVAPVCAMYGFDLWIDGYAGLPNPGPDFVRAQLRRAGHRGEAQFVSGDSLETIPEFFNAHPNLYFDLITVDGAHGEEDARKDLQNVLPRVTLGGLLVFDDICHPQHPWLEHVWDEVVGSNPNFVSEKFTAIGHGVAFAVRRNDTALFDAIHEDASSRLKQLNDRVREVDAQNHTLQTALSQMRAQFTLSETDRAARLEVIEEQGRTIASLQAQVHEQQAASDQKRRVLSAELARVREQLAASEADRVERLNMIEERDRAIGALQAQAQEQSAAMDQTKRVLVAELVGAREQLTASEADGAARLNVIEEQRRTIATLQLKAHEQQRAIEYLSQMRQQETQVLAAQLQTVQQALHAIQSSRIYKWLRRLGQWSWVDLLIARSTLSTMLDADALRANANGSANLLLENGASPDAAELCMPETRRDNRHSLEFLAAYSKIREPKEDHNVLFAEGVLDDIVLRLNKLGVQVAEWSIDVPDYRRYFDAAGYRQFFKNYYTFNLHEKSLEHYIAAKLLRLDERDVYIDIASEHSPAPDIYHRLFGAKTYRQDLAYPKGLHDRQIGGDAAHMPVPDHFASAMALHCSFEHFEGKSDIGFTREIVRVLRPGGRVCIVPLYLLDEYAVQTDPCIALNAQVDFDEDAVVYCTEGWRNRHARFYDPEHLVSRVIKHLSGCTVKILHVTNAAEVDPSCYVHFVMLIEQPPSQHTNGSITHAEAQPAHSQR